MDRSNKFRVYNTVYNITEKNKLEILLTEQQLKGHGIDTEMVPKIASLYETSDDNFIEKTNKLISNSYSSNSKLTRKDFIDLKELIEVFIFPDQNMNIPDFEIENDFFGIELPPGAYELVDNNAFIEQKSDDSDTKIVVINQKFYVAGFDLSIAADAISMQSISTTSNPIRFNSVLSTSLF